MAYDGFDIDYRRQAKRKFYPEATEPDDLSAATGVIPHGAQPRVFGGMEHLLVVVETVHQPRIVE
jgi:hypothetical protein